MLHYLTTYFRPDTYEEHYSLAIVAGRHGARLTHSHNRQYNYVLQSLTLWREILHDFFKLWYLAGMLCRHRHGCRQYALISRAHTEEDLLCEQTPYRLRDTGQGLNRLQACPLTLRLMHAILAKAQNKVDCWVGSSVVHMGDHNVPNALMFIDKVSPLATSFYVLRAHRPHVIMLEQRIACPTSHLLTLARRPTQYTQVARILNPIALCLRKIDDLHKTPGLETYIQATFGGAENCKKAILADFFRHGFDGSGAGMLSGERGYLCPNCTPMTCCLRRQFL